MGALCGRLCLCLCLCSLRGWGRRLLGGGGLQWFFWGDSSSLLSAIGLLRDTLGIVRLCDCMCAPLCVEERMPPQRGVMFWVCNEMN